jgi:hypothetical protein
MFRDWGSLAERVDDGGALNHHRRLFVSWQMCHRRFVDAPARIYVDSIDHLSRWFGILLSAVLVLILAGWCQEKAPIRCECEAPKKRRQSLVGVKIGILHAQPDGYGQD